jgi:hypothetical protein
MSALEALYALFRENEIPMSDRNGVLHDIISAALAEADAEPYCQDDRGAVYTHPPRRESATGPTQPLEKDERGVLRFKPNRIVQHLLDTHPTCDMNMLARLDFSDEDRRQFAQLIGYSLSGYGELSYVDEDLHPPRRKPDGTFVDQIAEAKVGLKDWPQWAAGAAQISAVNGAQPRRSPCTCHDTSRGPGRPCTVKAGGTLGELWQCVEEPRRESAESAELSDEDLIDLWTYDDVPMTVIRDYARAVLRAAGGTAPKERPLSVAEILKVQDDIRAAWGKE